jgi:uncharacterized protein YdeI (YjbR/CyaY-like superfamily)
MADQPTVAFATAAAFRKWLHTNHSNHPGIWLRIFKKSSGHPTVSYAEAVDEALCYGWIDGQKQKGDEASWLQKFTKRGPRSVWSKVNVGHVERLSRERRMQPAGFAAVESAKADGRWDRAYSPSSTAELPEDFLAELGKSPKAQAFFETLNKTNRYAVFYRLHSAKRPETRARRIADFIAMFERGEKIH